MRLWHCFPAWMWMDDAGENPKHACGVVLYRLAICAVYRKTAATFASVRCTSPRTS